VIDTSETPPKLLVRLLLLDELSGEPTWLLRAAH
jgi:hypothetical protein